MKINRWWTPPGVHMIQKSCEMAPFLPSYLRNVNYANLRKGEKKMHKMLQSLVVLSFAALPAHAATNPDAYSYQNILIGALPSVQASANNGAGVTFGIVDTGGTSSWVGFQGFNGNTSEGRITNGTCISP